MRRTNLIFLFSLLLSLFQITSLSAKEDEGILYYKVGYLEQAKNMLEAELASASGDKAAQLCYYLGNIYFKQNQPEKAAEYYNKGLSYNEKDPLNAIGLSKLLIKSNPTEAAEQLKSIQKKNKKNMLVAEEIGRAYLDNKEPEAALEYQTLVYEKDFQFAPGYILWGDIFDFKSEPGDAAAKYEMAITCDPASYDAYVKYARVINHVNMDAAIEKLQALKGQEPSLSIVDKELSELYYKKNDFTNAAKAYSEYIAAGNFTNDDLKQYAVTLLFAGDNAKSLEIARKGLAKDPTDPAFCRMVMYNLIDLQQYEEAAIAADNFFKKSKNPEFSYFDYMYLGRLYDAQKKFADAAEAYMKAVEKDPSKKQLYQMASQSYEEAGDIAKSLELYEKFVNDSEGGKNADNLMDLGRKYYRMASNVDSTSSFTKEDMLKKAIATFSEVSVLEPDNYRSFYWIGNAASSLDPEARDTIARNNYVKAYEIMKSKEDPRYNSNIAVAAKYLAVYYYMVNERTKNDADKENSIKYAKEVLSIDPNDATSKQIIEIFSK